MAISWFVAKLTGSSTIDESCRDNVVAFLTKHGIGNPSFAYVTGEQSETNPRFSNRVYYGTGNRRQREVSFVLQINEDIPYGWGAIVRTASRDKIQRLRQEWLRVDPHIRFSLYGDIVNGLGEVEKLDFVGRPA